ncbi:MAG: acetylxylan esterase [Verrucomicrobiota bacterium]
MNNLETTTSRGNRQWQLMQRWLTTAVCLLAFSAGAAGTPATLPFIINSDEASGIYPSDRDIVFTVKPGEGKTPADLEAALVKIVFNGVEEFKAEKSLAADAITLRVKPGQPGSYRCDVSQPVAGTKSAVVSAGAVVTPAKIAPAIPEPADFDAFWQTRKDALKTKPLSFELKPLSDDQRKHVTRLAEAGYECFDLSIEVPIPGIRPVRGYFARPKNVPAGGCPALLYLRAAGVSGAWCVANPWEAMNRAKEHGVMVLDINAHGIPNDLTKEAYQQLEKGELLDYKFQARTNKNTFYFVGMYLRLLRSVDFLCAQKEWDGRHLIAMGGSQGGGQALAAAGLDDRVSAVSAVVPAMCDLSGILVKRTSGWPNPVGFSAPKDQPEVSAAVSYCDNVNLASRSKAETQIFVGLIDTTCPPQGVFAAYNNLRTVKSILAYPHMGHTSVPKEDLWIGDTPVMQNNFIKRHLEQH